MSVVNTKSVASLVEKSSTVFELCFGNDVGKNVLNV